MAEQRAFVIVGAGLAGAKAAQTLREEGHDGPITLIGEEPERPYERPPLSKNLLLGTATRDSVHVHEQGWYADQGIDLRTGARVTGIDRDANQVVLADGERIGYDRLLLATGSTARSLPVTGADLDGVLRLRTLADSDRLAAALTGGARVVIAGGGWIGLEVAAAARQQGVSVTVVEAGNLPLQRVLGDQMASVFTDLHREHGVTFHLDTQITEIRGSGRVSSVLLSDGTELPADTVLVGIGAQPNTELAERAGLTVDNGVVVDQSMRTSDARIFAAGDIANAYHPLLDTHIRVEHWSTALNSGPAAARAMLGREVVYDRLPYFFTDQYDLGMEYTGHAPAGSYDRVVVRGDLAKREFVAFWTTSGRVLAGMNVNVWDVADPTRELIRSGRAIDPDRLADPDVPLTDL